MFESILKEVKPDNLEVKETTSKVNEFLKLINSKLKDGKAIVGGSFAKGTWLKGNYDIDVFVVFNDGKNLSERLEKGVKASFKKYERIHGSRDYFLVEFKGLSFELVPVVNIKKSEDAQNITDISLLHVKYVKANSSLKLQDEIRIAKHFLKVNNCYGAETYIGGFSGYLTELLVIYYGSFSSFIKKAKDWKYGNRINLEEKDNFSNSQEFPLVVIDPVHASRNVAAALREEKFDLFVKLCNDFVKSKFNVKYFVEKKVDLDKYDLVIKVQPLLGNKDVVGTKMLKCFEMISKKLSEFGVSKSGWFWNTDAYFYFNIKNKKLDKTYKHYGPPLKFEKEVENFKKKYKKNKVSVEKGRVFVILDREFTDAKAFVKNLIKDFYIKERVKKIELK